MDVKTHRFMMIALYLALIAGGAALFFYDGSEKYIALCFYAVFSVFIIYHDKRYYCNGVFKPGGRLFLSALLVIAALIQLFDNTRNVGFYFVLLIVVAVMKYEARFSVPFTIGALLLNFFVLLYHSGFDLGNFWATNSEYMTPRGFMLGVIVISRYAIIMSEENKRLAQSLEEKSLRLEEALEQLKRAMEECRVTADLRARQSLLQELHDRLGHMLTTAFIGVQAAGVLINKDAAAAKARLDMSAQRLGEAMQSLRNVISGGTINLDGEQAGFTKSMISLMRETEMRTGIPIRHGLSEEAAEEYDSLPAPIRAFLYNALMEGLTNGIRHGAATEFEFSLGEAEGEVRFRLSDNGSGFSELNPGFGITKMNRDAKRLGGGLKINGESGCRLELYIPLRDEQEGA